MKHPANPFGIKGYYGPRYFCDREKELARVLAAVKGNRNLVILSPRRMGKTSLLRHAEYHLSKKNIPFFYADLYGCQSMHDLVQLLARNVLGQLDNKPERLLMALKKVFSSLRPAIEFDEFTGAPSITFDISVREAKITTLEKILRYVESRKRRVVIALDEFQQVTRFREQNTEAQLRAAIQHCNYTHFIFSGSHRTIMTSMFGLPNRPFYNSAEMMELDAIAADVYARFIEKHFSEARKRMPFDVARYLVDICREHTYYIQFLSNRLFTLPLKKYDENTVRSVWLEVVQEQENTYYNYRNLMTENQWNLLKAVAREKSVEKITSSAFLQKHQLGTPSSVQRALQALMDAEFVFQWKGAYVVYDQFFAGWIAWKS